MSRSLTAAPPAGWFRNGRLVQHLGLDLGLHDLLATLLPAILMLGIYMLTVRAAWCLAGKEASERQWTPVRGSVTTGGFGYETFDETRRVADWREGLRPAVALGLFGGIVVVLSALVASLSKRIQELGVFFYAWRETLAAQVGWSFVILAVAVVLLGMFRTSAGSRIVGVGVAVTLGAGLALTLLANSRFAMVDRHDPVSSVIDHIAEAAINIDATADGNVSAVRP